MIVGTYVLATKYDDGDAHDEWAVGFFGANLNYGTQTRYLIVDHKGNAFRANGFRRMQKITKSEGDYILLQGDKMKLADSVWHVLRSHRRQNKKVRMNPRQD